MYAGPAGSTVSAGAPAGVKAAAAGIIRGPNAPWPLAQPASPISRNPQRNGCSWP